MTDHQAEAINYVANFYDIPVDTAVMLYSDEIEAYVELLKGETK